MQCCKLLRFERILHTSWFVSHLRRDNARKETDCWPLKMFPFPIIMGFRSEKRSNDRLPSTYWPNCSDINVCVDKKFTISSHYQVRKRVDISENQSDFRKNLFVIKWHGSNFSKGFIRFDFRSYLLILCPNFYDLISRLVLNILMRKKLRIRFLWPTR